MRLQMILRATATAVCLAPAIDATHALAQEQRAIEMGQQHLLRSRVMNETRRILVTLPETYDRTVIGYPVLFVLDGSSHILHATATTRFLAAARNRVPEMIVVAVPNTNRNRDLTPGPGASHFERFISEELIPWVDSIYRTVPHRLILGYSLGGSFVTHALLNRPELFDVYVAVSAPLWRYDSLARDMRVGLPRAARAGKAIHLAVGGDETAQLRGGMIEFVRALGPPDSSAGLRWSFTDLPAEDHSSTSMRSLYAALDTHYASYRFPFFWEEIVELDSVGGLAGVEAHYRRVGERFGLRAVPPEARILAVARLFGREGRHADAIALARSYRKDYPLASEQIVNGAGYDLLRRGEVSRAVEFFRENANAFPDSPNAHDSLADGLCRANDLPAAIESVRRAVGAAERRGHPRLPQYRERLAAPCPGRD
jgi:predicted alpha/beta superfamily hydrolase